MRRVILLMFVALTWGCQKFAPAQMSSSASPSQVDPKTKTVEIIAASGFVTPEETYRHSLLIDMTEMPVTVDAKFEFGDKESGSYEECSVAANFPDQDGKLLANLIYNLKTCRENSGPQGTDHPSWIWLFRDGEMYSQSVQPFNRVGDRGLYFCTPAAVEEIQTLLRGLLQISQYEGCVAEGLQTVLAPASAQ